MLCPFAGTRTSFQKVRQHYRDLLSSKYGDSATELLRAELPTFLFGLSSPSPYSAFHCLENLGYAKAIGNPELQADAIGKAEKAEVFASMPKHLPLKIFNWLMQHIFYLLSEQIHGSDNDGSKCSE